VIQSSFLFFFILNNAGMARKNQFVRPFPKQDSLYESRLVSVFITSLMKSGKKTVAERMVYTALSILKGKKERPVSLLMRAVKNITPRLTVKAIQAERSGNKKRRRRRRRKHGGQAGKSKGKGQKSVKIKFIPIELPAYKGIRYAFRWLKQISAKRSGKTMSIKLAAELIQASKNKGGTVRCRRGAQRMALKHKGNASRYRRRRRKRGKPDDPAEIQRRKEREYRRVYGPRWRLRVYKKGRARDRWGFIINTTGLPYTHPEHPAQRARRAR
jgi:small subunit ribosomal protein S7